MEENNRLLVIAEKQLGGLRARILQLEGDTNVLSLIENKWLDLGYSAQEVRLIEEYEYLNEQAHKVFARIEQLKRLEDVS